MIRNIIQVNSLSPNRFLHIFSFIWKILLGSICHSMDNLCLRFYGHWADEICSIHFLFQMLHNALFCGFVLHWLIHSDENPHVWWVPRSNVHKHSILSYWNGATWVPIMIYSHSDSLTMLMNAKTTMRNRTGNICNHCRLLYMLFGYSDSKFILSWS